MNGIRTLVSRRKALYFFGSAVFAISTGYDFTASKDKKLHTWTTSKSRRHELSSPLDWTDEKTDSSLPTIIIAAEKTYQPILGFGSALTDSACYTLNQLPPKLRWSLLLELFDPEQMALNVCRTAIGSSDYARKLYSLAEVAEDYELNHFDLSIDKEHIIPVLQAARSINPTLFLFASPWSPPAWMKTNKSMLGGAIDTAYLSTYARYFLRYLKEYEKDGVFIDAVTVQNEVDTDQAGRMPACLWSAQAERDFVQFHLGPLLRSQARPTEIWILDHNFDLLPRVLKQLQDESFRQYVGGLAWHGYAGTPEAMSTAKSAFPSIRSHFTEGGQDYTDSDYETAWVKWAANFREILSNWATSITTWNIALSEKGEPKIGPFPCGGLVTVNSATSEVTRSGQYWALKHFSSHVRRGAERIESTIATASATVTASSEVAGLQHIAFVNPSGQRVLVVVNAGKALTFALREGQKMIKVSAEADSVTTFAWS